MAVCGRYRCNCILDDPSVLLLRFYMMNKWVAKLFFVVIVLSVFSMEGSAQCAMCRATLENNVSNGNIGIAAGINFGILYLFAAPYIVIALIGFFWYRTSKRTAQNESKGSLAG